MEKYFLGVLLAFLVETYCHAQDFTYWASGNFFTPTFRVPKDGCDFLYSDSNWPHLSDRYIPSANYYSSPGTYFCGYRDSGQISSFGGVIKKTINCPEGTSFDFMSRICTYLSQKGSPGKNISCDIPSTKAGNPINIATANKYQREIDWSSGGIDFYRSYNSIDGLWRHSFSDHLVLNGNDITLILNDGREIKFKRSDSNDKVYRSISEIGTIENHLDGWTYRKDHGETLTFTQDGLLSAISKNYITHQINRENSENIISSDIYPDAYFTEDYFGQPKSFRFEGNQVYYSYSANKLVGVTITQDGESKSKIYHYENSKNPKILTGITDERGVRYATWSYDSQDRAISSEHAGGADKVTLVYNADGSTTVTNELGKKATYHFQVIQGVKRIVAIEGEPSPNCPSNNSTFTYDDRGLLKTKTDNKGYVTTYSYNDRGLEISRTEASGTAQARTTTTDWHPTLFLPETVTEPGRITHYQYDDQGRQLSQTIESL